MKLEAGEYHWRDGITFKRLHDGSVRVRSESHAILFIVPPNEWVSIIAHVSNRGENGQTYDEATALHDSAGKTCDCETGESCSDCDPEGHAFPPTTEKGTWLE